VPRAAHRATARTSLGRVRAVALRRSPPQSSLSVAARVAEPAALVGLMVASLALRAGTLDKRLWMDEAISVGIASHPLAAIPSVLRLDGSPPLYYVLLHLWMAVAGHSETALHALSAGFAVLCVPAAWWAGAIAGNRRTGRVAALLVACCPFVTRYAGDARMYTLVVLLGLACVGCFVGAYVHGRRGHVAWFGTTLALLVYTHVWALFSGVAFGVAFAVVLATTPRESVRRRLGDGALGFGLAGLLSLPWLPTAWFQAHHTGAPWATAPHVSDLVRVPGVLLGGRTATLVVVLVTGASLTATLLTARRERSALVAVLVALATVPVLLGWAASQISPAWTMRYLAIVVPPTMLLAAIAIVNARRPGMIALAAVIVLWATAETSPQTGDISTIARYVRPLTRPGDLVVSAAPGQVPVLAYYLPHDLRFASPFGLTRDPGVMDWRDAVRHLDRTSVSGQLVPLLDHTDPAGHVILLVPDRRDPGRDATPWARRVSHRAEEYEQALLHDRRFSLLTKFPSNLDRARNPGAFQALVFRKRTA
jgi:mannosyltransferase